jgi:hypothetical protein
MSQRHFGRPLARERPPDLALAVPAATALLFAGHDGWKLHAHIRGAEPAGSVTPPETDRPPGSRDSPADHAGVALVIAAVFTAISLVGGAAFCVGIAGLIAGRACGSALATWLVRRYERRLGRRYYRTVGEPEKIVWLGAPGLE